MTRPPCELTEAERIAWIRLARTDGIGPATFASLLTCTKDIFDALDAAPRLARRGGRELTISREDIARRELDAVRELSGNIIASCEIAFSPLLAAIDPPPPLLTAIGKAALLRDEAIAIVGARNASALGIKFAQRLSGDLGGVGTVIVSGLARGIDRAAHEAALPTGTIAVVAGGVDIVYPPENEALHRAIVEGGTIVSEMPLGVTPQARHFPRRNRIISGLSRGVVVIEAAERSGSLITASYALEQGREIFAVPGSPLDPRAKGCNRLIREGATLTTSADDVLAVLAPMVASKFATHREDDDAPQFEEIMGEIDDSLRGKIEEKLSPAPVEIDEIVRQCGAPAPLVLTVLLELELAQRLQRHSGAKISLR